MPACTFFGHRECPDTIKARLREALIDLIENHDVDMFYVGNQGRFDAIVRSVLRDLQHEYQQTNYAVVLAYMPDERGAEDAFSDTMIPEGIESIHPRYAISWRNNWMIQQSQYVVTYVTHTWGGAYKYVSKAKAVGKIVIEVNNIR